MKQALDIEPGLVSNDTTYAAQGRWYAMSGARFWQGRAQPLGGFESIIASLLSGVCRTVFTWTDNSNSTNIAFGRHNGLDVYVGGGLFNITPSAFVAGNIDGSAGAGYGSGSYGSGPYGTATTDPTYAMTWSLSTYGQTLIANARGQRIWQWSNNTGVIAAPVTNAPAVVTYALVVPQRQLIAFGCTNVGGTFDPMCIRGSDIEDITNWTITTANNAFETVLDSGSRIVCARVVANYLMVWTDSAYYLGTFIGAPDETWRFERQGINCGAIGPNAPVVDGQTVKWISPDGQFWVSGIGGAPQPIPCPIQTDFAANLAVGQNDKIVGTTVSRFKETRWFYADDRDGYEVSRSVAMGDDLSWSTDQEQPRTAYVDANPTDSPVAVTYGGNIYFQERSDTADGGQLSGYVETADFVLGDGDDLMEVNTCWPDIKDQSGTFDLTVYTRLYPQDVNIRTRGPYAMAPNRSKRDFRATGRCARVRIGWRGAPAQGRLGVFTFDLQSAGQR